MPIANIRGVNLRYDVIGADGPFVTLITGGRRGFDEFIPLAEKVAAHGYRVLLHDRRNTGASGILMAADDVEEAVWADDLNELLHHLDAAPAFIGGSSSGARTALMFGLRHPETARGLLLLRVSGGAFAAQRLPEAYYEQFIRIAREGGMEAICDTPEYGERIAANSDNRARLMAMSAAEFIDVQTRLRDLFVAGADLPVFGVTEAELNSIRIPTVVIPGNDKVHDSSSGRAVHAMIPDSEMHVLPMEDQDVPVVPFEDWVAHEPEIAQTLADFMARQNKAA